MQDGVARSDPATIARMTDRYAVIGNPVAHSKSPQIHTEFARQTGHDIAYTKIHAPLDGFKAEVAKFRDAGGKGLNITVPFKLEAWNSVNQLDSLALDAEAVKTIAFRGGEMVGFNTDGIGLVRDIKDNLQHSIKGQRILLMGAGGAAHGVLKPLLLEQPEHVVIVNRTLEKAQRLTAHFEAPRGLATRHISARSYDDFGSEQFDLVINATSASLDGSMPALPDHIFAGDALAYDMVYGKTTPFMQFAQAHGARATDGLGMLVEQAAESFFIWRGVRPQTAPVIALLRAAL